MINFKLNLIFHLNMVKQKTEGSIPDTPLKRKPQNQYTRETDSDIFNWIKSNCDVYVDKFEVFECWILRNNTIGIDWLEDQNQFRFSHKHSKKLVHVWMKEYISGDKPSGCDTSHLCHDRKCCRPSHTEFEDRSYNLSRNNCPGYVWNGSNFIKFCQHDPPCKVTSDLDSYEQFKLEEIKE